MKLIGGPLDGGDYAGEIDREKPFMIFPVPPPNHPNPTMEDIDLFSCYHLVGDCLQYISSKTRAQVLEMKK